jgi:hypothetical protein
MARGTSSIRAEGSGKARAGVWVGLAWSSEDVGTWCKAWIAEVVREDVGIEPVVPMWNDVWIEPEIFWISAIGERSARGPVRILKSFGSDVCLITSEFRRFLQQQRDGVTRTLQIPPRTMHIECLYGDGLPCTS